MAMLKDVVDGLKAVAEGIEHIRTVAKAIGDGKDYVKIQYPGVRDDLVAMCSEMRNTLIAIAAASAVLTHFRFTVAGRAVDWEPARFNNHLIAHKEKAARVSRSLHALRGHFHVIKDRADQLQKKAASLNLRSILLLFGIDSAGKDRQVANALRDIYDEEMQGYRLVGGLSTALQQSLQHVADALGPPGSMNPVKVSAAAALLGDYADELSALETESNYLALDLQQSIDELQDEVS
jgi:hypothetical protein